ncbi:GNAT family N-acetyltransferase [Paenibacillus methanolicus]|uniref:Putative GNAT family N-acyltransferase n=1 Tax=Paenibacillus methanolicus TaxID=582686 RepID=A0A5S5CIQ9_9BACL|nr:GNAT family N-acetyltransferase [Paenibacillus methanolicus]TYP79592.1 putative GNAT family N-acyltransferase [Paenibacillus methanolicus]
MITKQALSKDELEAVYKIRKIVFVGEQGVSEEEEYDEHEERAEHVLVYHEGQPVGTGRTRVVEDLAKMERICILPEYRKLGLGRHIMDALETLAQAKGLKKAKLHAQTHAEPFYEKLGYKRISDVFMEADIPHVAMVKAL